MSVNHKRAVSNYHLTLKLENTFSHKIKFKHSQAQLNDGETSEKCVMWPFQDAAIAERASPTLDAVRRHTTRPRLLLRGGKPARRVVALSTADSCNTVRSFV